MIMHIYKAFRAHQPINLYLATTAGQHLGAAKRASANMLRQNRLWIQ
jgi:hypothetical protein